jgi:hypothetical protein
METFVHPFSLALLLSGNEEQARHQTKSFIDQLETLLQNNKFVCGSTLSLADICTWSLLCSIESNIIQDSKHIVKWFNDIKALPEIQEAFKLFKPESIKIAALQQTINLGLAKQLFSDSSAKAGEETTAEVSVTQEELKIAKEKFVFQEIGSQKDPKVV